MTGGGLAFAVTPAQEEEAVVATVAGGEIGEATITGEDVDALDGAEKKGTEAGPCAEDLAYASARSAARSPLLSMSFWFRKRLGSGSRI